MLILYYFLCDSVMGRYIGVPYKNASTSEKTRVVGTVFMARGFQETGYKPLSDGPV